MITQWYIFVNLLIYIYIRSIRKMKESNKPSNSLYGSKTVLPFTMNRAETSGFVV